MHTNSVIEHIGIGISYMNSPSPLLSQVKLPSYYQLHLHESLAVASIHDRGQVVTQNSSFFHLFFLWLPLLCDEILHLYCQESHTSAKCNNLKYFFQESLLKSLQASVESEEVAWKKRLSDKEKDLHQLVADKANLQLQVKQLEDTIDKVKQAEDVSIHSFLFSPWCCIFYM